MCQEREGKEGRKKQKWMDRIRNALKETGQSSEQMPDQAASKKATGRPNMKESRKRCG